MNNKAQKTSRCEFVRFHNTIFAASSIESAVLTEQLEPHDFRDKHFYNVEVCLKLRDGQRCGPTRHNFEKCSMEEFDALTEKLGA